MNGTATSPSTTPLFWVSSWEKNLSDATFASGVTSHGDANEDVDGRVDRVDDARGGDAARCGEDGPVYCGRIDEPVRCGATGLKGAGRPPDACSYVPGGNVDGKARDGLAIQL